MTLMMAGATSAVLIGGVLPTMTASAAEQSPARSQVREVGAAARGCADKLADGRNGIVYVYATYNCIGKPICADDDNDKNYSKGGDCKGANNRSSSVLNKGYSSTYSDVRFYDGKGYDGGSLCLKDGKYIKKLKKANNKISSHKWVKSC
jgi:hypothetical protein